MHPATAARARLHVERGAGNPRHAPSSSVVATNMKLTPLPARRASRFAALAAVVLAAAAGSEPTSGAAAGSAGAPGPRAELAQAAGDPGFGPPAMLAPSG